MSKWTAKVTNKTLKDGQLRVDLEYSDGQTFIRDSMNTKSGQEKNWVVNEANRRCQELESLDTFAPTVEIGEIPTESKVLPVQDLAPKKLYASELKKLRQWGEAFRHGIAVTDHASFSTLKKWLQDNFDPDYLDLF